MKKKSCTQFVDEEVMNTFNCELPILCCTHSGRTQQDANQTGRQRLNSHEAQQEVFSLIHRLERNTGTGSPLRSHGVNQVAQIIKEFNVSRTATSRSSDYGFTRSALRWRNTDPSIHQGTRIKIVRSTPDGGWTACLPSKASL